MHLVHTEIVDSIVCSLCLAIETQDSKCYSPSICEQKLLCLTGINELKIIIFEIYYLTFSVHTKTTIDLSVSGQWWIFTEP